MSRYLMSIIGQSNELGSGPAGSASRVSGAGAPYLDGSVRSMWPAASQAMARAGCWVAFANTAVASTSLCDSWAGRCRTWVTSMVVVRGSYILSGGGFWRCAVAVGVASASTVAPTGTSNTTGADSVPWVYVGTPAAGDSDGVVYTFGSARYDPNGYIAAALAAVVDKPGYDSRGVLVSIGQTDYTVSSTLAQYTAAMTAVAQHITSVGLVCWLGMTCYMAGAAGRETYFQSTLLPGRLAALSALSGNGLVRQGADLRTALGVLVAPSADSAIGLQADELHLTSAGFDAAGSAQAASLLAGGWT